MKELNIIILGFFLSLTLQNIDSKEVEQNYLATPINEISIDSLKTKAFQILTNKCNICHLKQNRRRVFTMENMSPWLDDIYKQVFIKKRMPRGKKIKLTSKEYQELLTWITSTKNQD